MVNFIYYDIALFVLFTLITIIFLVKNKKKLVKENKVFFLYKTQVGINFIAWFSKKIPFILNIVSYIAILTSYLGAVLIILVLIELIKIVAIFKVPIPPIMPLIPYLPQIFNVNLPAFFFVHWIIILAITAAVHEFSHGIFAKFANLRIKSTGFGFLGPFLLAFVETDERLIQRKPAKQQLAIYSAGPFSNIILALIFLGILTLFFSLAYVPVGINFNSYYLSNVSFDSITEINNVTVNGLTLSDIEEMNLTENENLTIISNNHKYYTNQKTLDNFIKEDKNYVFAYLSTPAFENKITSPILEIDGEKVTNINKLKLIISNYKPGYEVKIKTKEKEYIVTLTSNPLNESEAILGVSFAEPKLNFVQKIITFFTPTQKYGSVYYETKGNEQIINFFYSLLWWLIVVNFGVGLINMLPYNFFDGGRIFFTTFKAITKSEEKAKKIFRITNFIITLLIILILILWILSLFK